MFNKSLSSKSSFFVRCKTSVLILFFLSLLFILREGGGLQIPGFMVLSIVGGTLLKEFFSLVFYNSSKLFFWICYGVGLFLMLFLFGRELFFLKSNVPTFFLESMIVFRLLVISAVYYFLLWKGVNWGKGMVFIRTVFYFTLAGAYIFCPLSLFSKIYVFNWVSFFNLELGNQFSHNLVFYVTVVCTGDVMAYLGGKYFKGKKLLPAISPNKTWAGFYFGCLGCALVSVLGFTIMLFIPYFEVLSGFKTGVLFLSACVFGVLSFVVAQMGDFTVSWLKRRAKVKDTGNILPGHGGLLDRVDGFLLAFPFMLILFEGVVYALFF